MGRLLVKELIDGYAPIIIEIPHTVHYYTCSNSQLRMALALYPEVYRSLTEAGSCAVCGQPVVSSWLECVHFQPAKTVSKTPIITESLSIILHPQVLGSLRNNAGVLPFRVAVCSYTCFNSEGHEFYGVADAG